MATFHILQTQNTLYLDRGGQPINGYRLRVELTEFDEVLDINVPSLDPPVVEAAIMSLIDQRRKLHALGGE